MDLISVEYQNIMPGPNAKQLSLPWFEFIVLLAYCLVLCSLIVNLELRQGYHL